MSHRIIALATNAFAFAIFVSAATAQESAEKVAMGMPMHDVAAAELTFSDIEVPGFLPGVKIAAIHGDPAVPDKSYTLRLAFPDGYKFPPHWHPRAENVTVLTGTLLLAMGDTYDDSKLKTYQPGDYLFIAGENPHYGQLQGETVLQLHGIGPFAINVVEGQALSP